MQSGELFVCLGVGPNAENFRGLVRVQVLGVLHEELDHAEVPVQRCNVQGCVAAGVLAPVCHAFFSPQNTKGRQQVRLVY